MDSDSWDDLGGSTAQEDRVIKHARQESDRVRLQRQSRTALGLVASGRSWLLALVIAGVYGGVMFAVATRTGHLVPLPWPDWVRALVGLVFGLGGIAGLKYFESSVRFYELVNRPYYRNRRRPLSPEMNALLFDVLLAGAGTGTVLAFLARALF